jgi:hypothetical protein
VSRFHFARIPRADNQPPAVGILFDRVNHRRNLVYAVPATDARARRGHHRFPAGFAEIEERRLTRSRIRRFARPAFRLHPVAPLLAIDRTQIAVFIRPFVPDAHLVFLQIADIPVAAQKPQQFVNDRAQMQLLGGEHWEIFPQIKPGLRAKHGIRARARAVGLELSVIEDVPQQIEVLNHRGKNLTTKRAWEKEI